MDVAELERLWWAAAKRFNVLPVDDRPLFDKAVGAPPRGIATHSRLAYPPGIPTIQRAFQPALAGRGYEIHARIARPTGQEEGVLTAFGSVETGWTLFIDDDRLVYENNLPRVGGMIVSSRTVPRGESTVGFRFVLSEGSNPLAGTGTLLIDGESVGEIDLPISVTFTNEGLDIGRDTLTAVSSRYEAPNPFTGSFDEVVFDLAPRPHRSGANDSN